MYVTSILFSTPYKWAYCQHTCFCRSPTRLRPHTSLACLFLQKAWRFRPHHFLSILSNLALSGPVPWNGSELTQLRCGSFCLDPSPSAWVLLFILLKDLGLLSHHPLGSRPHTSQVKLGAPPLNSKRNFFKSFILLLGIIYWPWAPGLSTLFILYPYYITLTGTWFQLTF